MAADACGAALARAWRESECAVEQTPAECMATCAHRRACARLATMHDESRYGADCDWCMCDVCHEWERT